MDERSALNSRLDVLCAIIGAAAPAADRDGRVNADVLAQLPASGVLAWNISAAFGGQQRSALAIGELHARLGRLCTSTRAIVTAHQLVAEVLQRWGTAGQQAHWLPRLAQGQTLAAFALSERDAGANPERMRAIATPCSGGFRLSGEKRWITSGALAGVALTCAVAPTGPAAFMVPLDAPGVTIKPVSHMLGFRAAMLAHIEMCDVFVPAEAQIGPDGSGLTSMVGCGLDLGRFVTAWGALGIQQECYRQARAHALRADAQGGRLLEHQLVRQLLARILVAMKSTQLLCREAATLRDAGDPDGLDASIIAKYAAARAAMQNAHDAVEVLGAHGCSADSPVERFFRDAKILEIIEGTNEALENVIGVMWDGCCE